MSNSDGDKEFERFVSAGPDEQETMLDEIYCKCRAETRRESGRGFSVDPRLMLFSVMVEVAIVLAAEIKPSRPFRGGRA
ncbi:MAG: hypothetical protein ACLPL5_14005 [Stellaceae bacterium]